MGITVRGPGLPWLVAGAINGPCLWLGLLTAPAINLVVTMQ